MEECRIADHADDFAFLAGLVQSLSHRDAAAHAQDDIQPIERLERAQAVAADVAGDDDVVFAEGIEYSAMRTARTQHRRTGRQVFGIFRFRYRGNCPAFHFGPAGFQRGDGQLANIGNHIVPFARNAQGFDVFFEEVVQLFDNQKIFDAGGKLPDQFIRIRIRKAQLQHGRFRPDLTDILIDDAMGNDTQRFVAPFDTVGLGLDRSGLQVVEAFFDGLAHFPGPQRHGHKAGRIFLKPDGSGIGLPLAELDDTAGVADPRGGA